MRQTRLFSESIFPLSRQFFLMAKLIQLNMSTIFTKLSVRV